MRAVVYVLVLLVVIGMILTMVGSALAAATPASPAGAASSAEQASFAPAAAASRLSPAASPGSTSPSAAASGAPRADQPSQPAPVVVLGTGNLTWADLQAAASATTGDGPGTGDAGSAAAHLLSFASQSEPINLAVRTPADRTCPADGWLTLGRGARASAVKPTGPCTSPSAPVASDSASPLARTLGQDVSVMTVGSGAQLATGAPEGSPSTTSSTVSSSPSLSEALATGADLTIVDTTEGASTDAERITALDGALRVVQEQARPGTRILIASLADDEDPGPQMAVLPAGTTSARGTSGGLIVGTSTHRAGLAQLTDLTPTLTTALAGRKDPAFDGQPLSLPVSGQSGAATATTPNTTAPDDARITRLADDALHARASQLSVLGSGALLVVSAALLLVWAALALRGPRPDRRRAVRRRVTWAAIVLSALPTALLLVNAVPWWRVGARHGTPSSWAPAAVLAAAVVIAACIVGATAGIVTLVHRWRSRPLASPSPSSSGLDAATAPGPAGSADPASSQESPRVAPQPDEATTPEPSTDPAPSSPSPPLARTASVALLVAAMIPLAWLVDAAAGAHLAFNNPLGMNAVVAGRFYGVSNTAFALVAGALVVVTAGAWEALGRGRRTALALTGLLGGAALIVDGAPQLGADVGGALTLVPTLAYLGAGLAGLRLSWRRWLAIGAATVLVVGGFGVVDLFRPAGPTHLGRFVRQLVDGSAAGVLGRKAYALVGPFVTRPDAAAGLVCALALIAAAIWWLRRQVRAWRAGTSPYVWLASTADGDVSRGGGPNSCPRPRDMSPSVHWGTTALRSLGVLTVVSVLVNDSGVTMAGFILAAAAPALLALLLTLTGSASPQPTSVSPAAPTESLRQ
ncbi:Uncharacterised protein [Actinomyces viscosus]|uniref:Uncharacterized protein n=1 Tax=Actinomyces viscosus TaxID=1656 RepID=A0A448PMS7_ACTVI|nr:Uncharacterised protein [Actinomyces viscosus]